MEKPYEKELTVSYYETDANEALTLQNVVKYLMETAVGHTEDAGYTIEKLASENLGWVVLNWVIRIYSYPVYKEKLRLCTWAKPGSSLQATRYFKIKNEKDEVICEVVSRWALLDLVNRHPVRFSDTMNEAYCCAETAPFEPDSFNPAKENPENLVSERKTVVRRSETDTNGHTNNTVYIEWATNDVPDDIYLNYRAEEIKVLYRNECHEGNEVYIKTYKEEKEDKILMITSMTNAENKVLCKMSSEWRKK